MSVGPNFGAAELPGALVTSAYLRFHGLVRLFLGLITAVALSVIRWIEWVGYRGRFAALRVTIGRRVVIENRQRSELTIGPDSVVGLGTLLILESRGAMRAELRIGRHTAINEYNNIRAAGAPIHIGNYCQIAQFCTLVSSNHSTETTQPMGEAGWDASKLGIYIEDDVWIGANSVVLPGVRIGRGSVIGAGSVVTKEVPPFSVYAGNPAKLIRRRTVYSE